MLTKVKNQIEDWFVFVVFVGFRSANFYQIHDIFVLKKLKNPNLTKSCDWELIKEFHEMMKTLNDKFILRLLFRSPLRLASLQRICCHSLLVLWKPLWIEISE